MDEDHGCDKKAIKIAPSKLLRTICAFANADGGELFVGISEDKANKSWRWEGFQDIEEANGHLQAINNLFDLGSEYNCSFLEYNKSFVLHIEVQKTQSIKV